VNRLRRRAKEEHHRQERQTPILIKIEWNRQEEDLMRPGMLQKNFKGHNVEQEDFREN
jgi:hypothetical protein